jgi:hypothetical protein
MEFIDTHRITHDGKPLYISYEFFDDERYGQVFNVFLDTYTGQKLIERIEDLDYSRVYGYLTIIPGKFCSMYMDGFYIQYDKYPNDVTVLKGLGKTMLCMAMNILLKTHTIDTICLTAQSRRKDDAFYKELVHNWSGEMIARYIIDKRWGPYYNKTIDGYCDYDCNIYKIGKRRNDIGKLGTFIDTYNVFGDISKSFKLEICDELARRLTQEKLIHYYKRYGFKIAPRPSRLYTHGMYMVASIQSLMAQCSSKSMSRTSKI